jgi:DinB family protein
MITEQEREKALDLLTRSRQTLLTAVEGVTENQARWKPEPGRWSILEYVEHLAIGDDALVALIGRALKTPAQPETEEQRRAREKKIRETTMPRGVNHAPDGLHPAGRFASLPEAVAAFLAARERTMQYARSTQEDLRDHFAPHSVLGPLDGYQWLIGNARHAENHSAHIREIREMPAFPQ